MKSYRRNLRKIHGFSLVELMVAMTIGLIILAAVSTLFVSSKATYTTQDSLSRLQENARFAMQFIIKDLRMAGYYGCIDDISPDTVGSTLNSGADDFFYNAQIPIEGLNNGGTWYPSGNTANKPTGIKSGTDAVIIRKGDSDSNLYLDQEMPNTSAVLKLNQTDPVTGATIVLTDILQPDEILMISDCSSADIFQATQLNDSDPHVVHNTGAGTPGNFKKELSKAYSPSGNGTRLMKFTSSMYYVATGAGGNPALFRKELNRTAVEVVEGIEDLQILYGKDTDSDGVPNIYLKAGDAGLQSTADWNSVISARIGVLARTLNDPVTGKPKEFDKDSGTYDVDGDGTPELTANDNYKRRVFQSVVQLRNL